MRRDHTDQATVIKAAGGLLWRGSQGGREMALIHRASYDDWTLPKGKLKEGESWQEAALREVREETECDARLGDFSGCTCYTVRGVPKVVLFWHMDLVEQHPFAPNRERDQLAWASTEQALQMMSYADEKAVVKRGYYVSRKDELLQGFDCETLRWAPVIARKHGMEFSDAVLREARRQFERLIPEMPYIGGEANHLTASLLYSARCLALFKALKARGGTAQETGELLYQAIVSRLGGVPAEIPTDQSLTDEQLMVRRRERAKRSQQRRYAEDWVYGFVPGDGEEFDYGYDFVQCATQKLYQAQGADEFLPFYCFLDFPESQVAGLGLSRTTTLAEGHLKCNHRFKKGRQTEPDWPPPFAVIEGGRPLA
jgi:ADP-ribose pyrophosphatase YjhB (NUDIX family)